MAIVRDEKSRLEEYRRHLKASVEELLENVDGIIDFCYTESISKIHIDIEVSPESTIPTVTYSAEHQVTPYRKPISTEMQCSED